MVSVNPMTGEVDSNEPKANHSETETDHTEDPLSPPDAPQRSPGGSVRDIRTIVASIGAALALPIVLYVALQPENFGLTPNSLDPLFYSGYAINFDDVMNAVQDRHYFVSRWTSYYPGYIADRIAGPFVGRLLLRALLAASILGALWSLGKLQRWNWPQRILIGTLILTMPTFVRAFFTDYVEYIIVALGICLVTVCIRGRPTVTNGLLAGSLAAAIVIANPIAVTAVLLPLAFCIFFGSDSWRQRLSVCAAIVGAGVAASLAGLALFRWRYGIPNVYEPSIDFMRTYQGGRDGWKSPRLDWLWNYTWLYMTPVMLLFAAALAAGRRIKYRGFEIAAFALCGLQYVYQWLDQFLRDGNGLEISYYWSYAYPTFAVALALLVGRLTESTSKAMLIAATAGWIVFLTVGVPDLVRLPDGFFFAAVTIAALILFVGVSRRSLAFATLGLVAFLGWLQIGAPNYDSSIDFSLDNSPHYDRLYGEDGDLSEAIYREAVWFAAQMDTVPNDASTSFVTLGTWSSSISALYAASCRGKLRHPQRRQSTPERVCDQRDTIW